MQVRSFIRGYCSSMTSLAVIVGILLLLLLLILLVSGFAVSKIRSPPFPVPPAVLVRSGSFESSLLSQVKMQQKKTSHRVPRP